MQQNISLKLMSPEMYHEFFREYQNDPDLYLSKNDYIEYIYDKSKVNEYIEKQDKLNRICFAIMCKGEIVGELKLYNIVVGQAATLGIALKNQNYKDKGIGTRAEQLAIEYVFNRLNIPTLYADSVLTNTRSQHVLEKVGFRFIHEDERKRYYQITRQE